MSRTYLDEKNKTNTITRKTTYIPLDNVILEDDKVYNTNLKYYNKFSEAMSKIGDINNHQQALLQKFLLDFSFKANNSYYSMNADSVLPNFNISKDVDDAIVITWANSNYRIFVNIEKNTEDSFYGAITRNEFGETHSSSGTFNEDNCDLLTTKIIDYLTQKN